MSITKNKLSPEEIRTLCHAAFPGRAIARITELTEGMFNAASRIDFGDGGAAVLKVSPATRAGQLQNEVNLMRAEVSAMEIARAHGIPLVPEVYLKDFSRTRCTGDYFLMECLPGQSLNRVRDSLSPAAMDRIMTDVGRYQRQLTSIRHDTFGLLGDTLRFPHLADLVAHLMRNLLSDAQAKQVALPIPMDEVLPRLALDRAAFDGVQPTLVHWDMWEGNIFVEGERLTGVIDWERAMWGDALMDDRFRRGGCSPAFLAGFGAPLFTPQQRRRIAWYDLYLYATMAVECFYRLYDNADDQYRWCLPLIEQAWQDICRKE